MQDPQLIHKPVWTIAKGVCIGLLLFHLVIALIVLAVVIGTGGEPRHGGVTESQWEAAGRVSDFTSGRWRD